MAMLCRSPFAPPSLPGIVVGCGQCGPCRAKRQMTWVHRIMLETLDHKDNSFWSLSYETEHLTFVKGTEHVVDVAGVQSRVGVGTLNRADYVLFLKRLREAFEPAKFRFFIVGEYGEKKWRPHYHVILFGFPRCERGMTIRDPATGAPVPERCCKWCKMIHAKWGMGNVYGGDVTPASARYCAAYTLKKMTKPDDPRLSGRHPEFARFSLKPGIGVNAMYDVASSLLQYGLDKKTDVPTHLRHGKALMPIGRTLRGKLRKFIGREDETPQKVLDDMAERLSLVRAAAFNDSVSFTETVKELMSPDYLNWEAKRLIYSKGNGNEKV